MEENAAHSESESKDKDEISVLFGGSSDTVIEEIKKSRAMIMTMLVNELNRHGSILSTDIEALRNQLNAAPRL